MPYHNHRNFNQLAHPKDVTVCRYMSKEKLISLLETQSLYFKKVKEFQDQYEGRSIPWSVREFDEELGTNGTTEHVIYHVNNSRSLANEFVYANCWSINDKESSVMWGYYGKSHISKLGVCIRTTAQNLYDSILDGRNVYSAVIEYTDSPVPTLGNMFMDCFVKSIEFEDEKELRLWVAENYQTMNTPIPKESSFNIKVDTKKLIQKLIVSPFANEGEYNDIKTQLSNYLENVEDVVTPSNIKYRS